MGWDRTRQKITRKKNPSESFDAHTANIPIGTSGVSNILLTSNLVIDRYDAFNRYRYVPILAPTKKVK